MSAIRAAVRLMGHPLAPLVYLPWYAFLLVCAAIARWHFGDCVGCP